MGHGTWQMGKDWRPETRDERLERREVRENSSIRIRSNVSESEYAVFCGINTSNNRTPCH
jgi:hypothetical protein